MSGWKERRENTKSAVSIELPPPHLTRSLPKAREDDLKTHKQHTALRTEPATPPLQLLELQDPEAPAAERPERGNRIQLQWRQRGSHKLLPRHHRKERRIAGSTAAKEERERVNGRRGRRGAVERRGRETGLIKP